ncbi:hypothetical protein [Pseudomonas sp. R1-7]|uniref:hypothetical protein n=1 Tax=Pseudomonas sp. R1-7 TaxID=2817398 RepID=UPI003DA86D58
MDVTPTTAELVNLFNGGRLANQMACGFGMSGRVNTHELEKLCITLHNAGTIDLLALVENGAIQELQGTDFFSASCFLCRLLPELDTSPERMMRCVNELVVHGGTDGAANEPNAAFREWCEHVPQRAKEVIAAALKGDELACHHLAFALEATNDLIEARRITLGYETCRQAAIAALGRIQHPNSASCAETFTVFNALLDGNIDDFVRASVLHASMRILACGAYTSPADANLLISRLLINPSKFTIHQCAHVLWAYQKALTLDIVTLLLGALSHMDSANKGTVEELDIGLQTLLKLGYDEPAVSFVTELLSRPDNNLELGALDSFSRTLLSGPPDVLSRVVVQWLGLGAPRLCNGLADAIQGPRLDGVPLNLKADDLALSPTAQLFICRKAVGWFFFKPITAASILVSVLQACDANTAQEVQKLLIDPLLQNYSGVRKYLESLAPDDTGSKAIIRALAHNESNLKAQQTVPLIVELQPSEHHRRIERLRISDQMRDAHKQAESASVFLNLISRSVLLYGNRSLSFVDDGQERLRPMEFDLHSHGVSYEMPRMSAIDPVGLDYILRVFRNERMEK